MKKIIPVMLIGLSISLSPVALADPVQFTGDITVKYEKDTADASPNVSGTMSTIRLNAEKNIGNNWSMYARLGAQNATRTELADYNPDAYHNKKSAVALDQFGFIYKNDKFTYKLGRQAAAVRADELLYKHDNIGRTKFVDGLSVSGTIGAMDVFALLAQEDNVGSQDNKISAIRTGYSSTENLNWGVTLRRFQDQSQNDANHWEIDGTYKFGKNSLTAEYTSSSDADSKAYAANWNYAFDNKNSAYITGFSVQPNSYMVNQGEFDIDNRGLYYGIVHQLNGVDAIEVVYKDQRTISSGQKNTKFETTFTHTF